MVILCHDDPCIVIYLLLIFQFQYQRQIIFRIFIDQILDLKLERNGIFCLRIAGKLSFFNQTFTVHTPYLKGDPFNLPSELLYLTGNTASLSERADRLPFIADIRLQSITAQTVHPLPADIHIDKRQTCGTHLLGHIRISLIHKIADHHQWRKKYDDDHAYSYYCFFHTASFPKFLLCQKIWGLYTLIFYAKFSFFTTLISESPKTYT